MNEEMQHLAEIYRMFISVMQVLYFYRQTSLLFDLKWQFRAVHATLLNININLSPLCLERRITLFRQIGPSYPILQPISSTLDTGIGP